METKEHLLIHNQAAYATMLGVKATQANCSGCMFMNDWAQTGQVHCYFSAKGPCGRWEMKPSSGHTVQNVKMR